MDVWQRSRFDRTVAVTNRCGGIASDGLVVAVGGACDDTPLRNCACTLAKRARPPPMGKRHRGLGGGGAAAGRRKHTPPTVACTLGWSSP